MTERKLATIRRIEEISSTPNAEKIVDYRANNLQKPNILANRWKHPDGTILQSFYQHHFVKYKDCFVDGGLSGYMRISGDLENCCVYTDSPFEEIREGFHWGTYGKNADQPLTFKPLKDLDTDHIEAIVGTQWHLPDHIVEVFNKELLYRGCFDV